ncbi:glycosyltransferase [Enterobacteriaceae bacterium H18W14]|uniref:glycosyltransferase family 2 protein n=1 Tax=Dryocola boscaweniae TaxID=2925397 RepID=UPI0022F08839|nr:glycosyltransferase [Dryocola boscaweniae]MCT4716366.1 glycosyltransferase [Dryocola boscaweniae]
MSLPKISVLIPCYNHEKYVAKCLESTVTAYSGELEVIICDDKSKDNSVNIIESFINGIKKDNITYSFFKNSKNQGVAKTLNECVRHATADYIYTIASDDYLLEGGLTKAMSLLLQFQSDAVISDCLVVDGDSSVVNNSAFFEYRHASLKRLHKKLAEELVFNWVAPGPALLQKKASCIDIGGYNERLIAEDRDYYLKLLANKNAIFNLQPIAGYRVHLHNASRSRVYLEKAGTEFCKVNYAASILYQGLPRLYLKSYWLDLNKIPLFLTSKIRKFIKALYILRG